MSLNGRVLLVSFAVTTLTGLLFGLAPALQVARDALAGQLRHGSRSSSGRGRQRLRGGLVVAEVALALVLLAGAGLFLRSFQSLVTADPGFDPENVLSFLIALPEKTFPEDEDRVAFYERAVARIGALPGVRAAAATTPLLGGWQSSVIIEGMPLPAFEDVVSSEVLRVTPDYFAAVGMRLERGRLLSAEDRATSRKVAVIDTTFATSMWPEEDPLGRRFRFGRPSEEETPEEQEEAWIEVVGVVNHIKSYGVDEISFIQSYLPITQSPQAFTTIIAKTAVPPQTLIGPAREAIETLDRDVPIADVQTLEERLGGRRTTQRLAAGLLGIFAGLALLLAAIGIYGVLAYAVSQRRREIGIRMAVGAAGVDVLRLVVVEGMRLVTLGIGLGVGVALVLAPRVRDQLFAVEPRDPRIFLAVTFLLALIALAACVLPARRAARVNPTIALHQE